jgi:TPR repeat protein
LIKGEFNKNGQTPEDIKKGFELLNGLSNDKKSCPEALAELGYLYEHGSFNHDKDGLFKVPVDLKKAIDLNERARKLFLPRAVNNLGLLYFNHKDMNPNNAN